MLLLATLSSPVALAQATDTGGSSRIIGGAVTVTTNGISLLPTFSLNKPAVIFDGLVGGDKLTFEPQLRFALEGKPWSFIFWWRYNVVRAGRFSVNAGAHPAIVFKSIPSSTDPESAETIIAHRYLAAELSPRYSLTGDITLGLYYLYSHGFDPGTTSNTHFVTANATFAHLALTRDWYLRVAPQLYYLRMDDADGYYATATVSLLRHDFPVYLQSIVNQAIDTDIVASGDIVWNVSLIYSFRGKYENTLR